MYNIHEVTTGAAATTEPLGTKYKFWYHDPNFGLSLFKEGRPNTGENWAEKIACELAKAIGLPNARYELATYEGRNGVLSPTMVERGARIVHGNKLLAHGSTNYIPVGGQRVYGNPNHTLRRVLAYLRASTDFLGAPYNASRCDETSTALDFFVGYLMFDAWIANQDRHDENWGVLRTNDGNLFLAPTYDHGSSMARNLSDDDRLMRLNTKDMPRHITSFIQQARSGLYPVHSASKPKPLYTLEAFEHAAMHSPRAAAYWKLRLQHVTCEMVKDIVAKIPGHWMSEPARLFTIELLRLNKLRILSLPAR